MTRSTKRRRAGDGLHLRARLFAVSLIEAGALFGWLLAYTTDEHGLALMSLIAGEVIETAVFRWQIGVQGEKRWGPLDRAPAARRHYNKVERITTAAGIAEVAIWLAWLTTAERIEQPELAGVPIASSVLLLVLMHLKHHTEAAAVRDMPYRAGFFAFDRAIASAMEVAAAIACLALIEDDAVAAALVLLAGIHIEHDVQIGVLRWEMKNRDIRVPRDRRWPPAPRWWSNLHFVVTHFPRVWRLVERIGPLRRRVNRFFINTLASAMAARPNPLSTMAPYTSWPSLTDRTYSGRHLPPAPPDAARPATTDAGPPTIEEVVELFRRREHMTPCPKSTVLFAFFAEWFTSGFLRTRRPTAASASLDIAELFRRRERMTPCPKPTVLFAFVAEWFSTGFLRTRRPTAASASRDITRNESPHEVDLGQLYGMNPAATAQLRGPHGLLKSQTINGEEYPWFLCRAGKPKEIFDKLPRPLGFEKLSPRQKAGAFAIGTDVANVGALAFNVLFLRAHNKLARELRAANPCWDEDRVFETTRNILIVVLLQIVVWEYINHITPNLFRFRVEPGSFRNAPWFRQNWMAVEFNLLYRWHSLLPSTFCVNGAAHALRDLTRDNTMLTNAGLGSFMAAASTQPAGRIGLFNTDADVLEAEAASLRQARTARLASYNDYRRWCGLPPAATFEEISPMEDVHTRLQALYDNNVDDVEFYVGLFAEEPYPDSVLPPLMTVMVACDAFSQALTNPLLAPRVFNEETFSPAGMKFIERTKSIADLLKFVNPASEEYYVSFTRRDYKRL